MTRLFHLPRRPRLMGLLLFALALLTLAPAAFAQDEQPAAAPGLQPGAHVTYKQKVPINLVFVGYEPGDFTVGDLRRTLPGSYAPVVRYPRFYGLEGRDMGLRFNFDYNVKYAPAAFEDDFFGYLGSIGAPGPLTAYQAEYNNQTRNVLDVGDTVLYIDAPSAENWLMSNANRLNVNTAKGYTIFFVNWYSRPDFQFHVYTKTDYTDPDTGYNFGEIRATRKIIAWGGTHGRTWFYDLSAGPEAWTDNWNVDNPDLDGDGYDDYRMPPIWEYADGGFRDPAQLGQDLGLVARFVAINLLFTSSPLYDPMATSPDVGGQKIADVEMFELDGVRAVNGVDFLHMDHARAMWEGLQPYYDWYTVVDEHKPPDAGVKRALRVFSGNALLNGCWEEYGTPGAQLFCYFDQNYDRYIPAFDPEDSVSAFFTYHITAHKLGAQWGLLGFADDNWIDGTPSYVFSFDAAEYRELGYGFTDTITHEGGHHFGLSHPHDGYDSELDIDYGPGADFYFAWSGDESDTVMHYISLSGGFGQFDQDNMNRYVFAGYLNWANDLLAGIQADPNAAAVRAYVRSANDHAVMAQRAFNQWDYAGAAAHARLAWEQLQMAAMQLGISTEMSVPALRVAPTGQPPREGDPIRFPND